MQAHGATRAAKTFPRSCSCEAEWILSQLYENSTHLHWKWPVVEVWRSTRRRWAVVPWHETGMVSEALFGRPVGLSRLC